MRKLSVLNSILLRQWAMVLSARCRTFWLPPPETRLYSARLTGSGPFRIRGRRGDPWGGPLRCVEEEDEQEYIMYTYTRDIIYIHTM